MDVLFGLINYFVRWIFIRFVLIYDESLKIRLTTAWPNVSTMELSTLINRKYFVNKAIKEALATNNVKPILNYIDKSHYGAATIILSSDSKQKEKLIRNFFNT